MKLQPYLISSQSLSFLTINVWFGLEERGILKMNPIESNDRREKRYEILVGELRLLQPDFIAIQEANPIPQYSRRLATDLGYDEIHQVYNGGIKIGPLGIPVNLRMGLMVLAKKGFHLRWAGATQISGDPFGLYGDFFCFHLTDSRQIMAGMASVEGKPLYVINTHTYAGVPESHDVTVHMDKYRYQGRVSGKKCPAHLSTARHTTQRHKREVERILSFLQRTTEQDPAVLLGDFNMTEDNPLMVHLMKKGRLWDSYRIANPHKKGFTWDADDNENTRFSQSSGSDPDDVTSAADHFRAVYDRESRRIDYILLNSVFRKNQIRESRVVLDQAYTGVHVSDHYGVMTVVALRPECGHQ